MTYVSRSQQGWFNTHRKKLGSKIVDEWNKASKGEKNLPDHVASKRRRLKALTGK